MNKRFFATPLAAAALLLGGAALAADSQTLTIKDWTGRGFAPDLVNYTIAAPADGGASLRVLDADGASLPVQVTPGADGGVTLSFVAEIPPNGTSTYTVRADGQAPPAPPAVSASLDGETLVLANQRVAVRVPAPREQTFEPPVAANTLPAPILAFRGPFDRLRAGPDGSWRGQSAIGHDREVSRFTVEQTAGGSVYLETRYRLEYAEGGWYEATVRVVDQAPFARIEEDFDLGVDANLHFWQLDLSHGWEPDSAEHINVAGQGAGSVQYPTLAAEERASPGNIDPSLDAMTTASSAVRMIHHDSCWGARFVSYYGVHNAAAREADPRGYPLAMVAPLHKGAWRRANSLPVFVGAGHVRIAFPMDVAPTSWLNEPRSDTSPFSCHEHDPELPTSYGRRIWALVLGHPPKLVQGFGDTRINTLGAGYAVRNFYGSVGLDRYKDYVLEWEDAGVEYPRVFITPEGVERFREAVEADPAFPLRNMVANHYWFTGDPATARQELPRVHQALARNVDYIVTSQSIHHHHTLGQYGGPIAHTESVLSWADLPETDRTAIRARLALLSYLLAEPDVTSAANGSHHGNPNMGVSRLSDRSNLAALIPDHPMHDSWAEYMADFLAYKQGTFMAPEGAWFEYGASYHMHGYGKILRGMMGLLSSNPAVADLAWNYNRANLDYFLNLLSPVDPRYGSRTIPGMANSPAGQSPHYLQSMGNVAERDPEFAAHLRWAWDHNGRMISSGGDALTIPAMVRPEIPAAEPPLVSRNYPGFGVVLRAHPGDDETALFLRSGYHWSHWNHDQGNLMLYAKGAVLLPPQPYQYGRPSNPDFVDKNMIRFGTPNTPYIHAWADSNILDTQFGDSVDYAWSSSGYPDWYITPGAKDGWVSGERDRKLAPGIEQREGAFTWDRQVLFLKSPNPRGANYFVIRDSKNGDGELASWFNLSLLGRKDNVTVEGHRVVLDTEWPTNLEMLFTDREQPAFDMVEDDLPLGVGAYSRPTGESRDWVNGKEQQVLMRMQSAPGQEVAWVLYPRGAGEAAPSATQLAPGVTKVDTGEGVDYVFLSTTPLQFEGEGIEFAGTVGAVRVPRDGEPELLLLRGSTLSFRGRTVNGPATAEPQVIAESDRIRFVAPAAEYVRLTHGNVGVRGLGPFDLTFTPDGITGTVDGDVRTLVTTWPENIVRPGYWMDGERWFAGFADEHSIVKGTETPQFAIAIGVSAGEREIRIAEWEWPALPTPPPRAKVNLR